MKLEPREKDIFIALAVFIATALVAMTIMNFVRIATTPMPRVTVGNSIEELYNTTDGDYVAFPTNDNSSQKFTIVDMRNGREYSSNDSSGAQMIPIKNPDGTWSYNIKWLNHLDQVNHQS